MSKTITKADVEAVDKLRADIRAEILEDLKIALEPFNGTVQVRHSVDPFGNRTLHYRIIVNGKELSDTINVDRYSDRTLLEIVTKAISETLAQKLIVHACKSSMQLRNILSEKASDDTRYQPNYNF